VQAAQCSSFLLSADKYLNRSCNENRYLASFPDEVSNKTQFAAEVKSHAVYLSQYQLLPYERIAQYLNDLASLPISPGSLCDFNQKAYDLLAAFDGIAKQRLIFYRLFIAVVALIPEF